MSTFQVPIKVASLKDPVPHFTEEAMAAWVDNGATFTQLPRKMLEKLGIVPFRKEWFGLADGRKVQREIGLAFVLVEGIVVGTEVTFAEEGEPVLLGALTLEQAGFYVDPRNQKLVRREAFIQY